MAGRRLLPLSLALPLAGCGGGVLDPVGPVGAGERIILLNSLAIMLAIVVPTIVALLGFAWWFRAGNKRATYLPDWSYSGRIELVVWSIPILVILFLGGVIWVGSHRLDPYEPIAGGGAPLEVQVVALDWKWLFLYPGQSVASVNRLVIPVGRPVHFRITSASVMNAFFVPRLGSMIYAMNGMTSQLNLRADRPGRYFGQSAHFSGDGFADMHFEVDAVPAGRFDRWVARAKADGPVLDAGVYEGLKRQGTFDRPFTYRAVDPRLFAAIVAQRIAPAPGPQTGRSHGPADVTPRSAH